MNENNHAGGSNSHLGWKCYSEVNHIFLFDPAWIKRYPKGKTVIFIFLLGDIVGSMTWVGTLVLQLLFEENWLCLGLWEIFINMEDIAWAHLNLSKRSWLCEKENCLGVVKKWPVWLFTLWLENGLCSLSKFISRIITFGLWTEYAMSVFHGIFIKNGNVIP